MKKIVLFVAVAFMSLFGSLETASAANPLPIGTGSRAAGLRFGPDLEFSYQHNMNQKMFLEGNLSFPYNFGGLGLEVTNNWLFDINSSSVGSLNWYLGAGAGVGFDWTGSSVSLGLVPRIGIEYAFAGAPIQLALDYKPSINFVFGGASAVGVAYYNIGFAVRYTF